MQKREIIIERIYEAIDTGVCVDLFMDVLDMIVDKKTTDTGKKRIFQCEMCGYGLDDIFLSDEVKYQIMPKYCPNCGRLIEY